MFDESISITANTSKIKSKRYFYYGIKRLFDIIVSGLAILILSPMFLLISILIKIDSKGPAILKQTRIGNNGKAITIYKFRSMIDHAEEVLEELMQNDPAIYEEYTNNKKLKNDPRVTRVGKLIRKTSIDELPQLLNIFNGDMTFVGPRPYLPREKNDMGGYYSHIIKMTPGLTGLWQVNGRSDCGFKDRLKFDCKYYRIRSLKIDLKIMLRTFSVVLSKKGAK